MSVYRTPPPVLPSQRELGEEPTATIRLIRAIRAMIEPGGPCAEREREEDARERAAAAPCPGELPPAPHVVARPRLPPATTTPGTGQRAPA